MSAVRSPFWLVPSRGRSLETLCKLVAAGFWVRRCFFFLATSTDQIVAAVLVSHYATYEFVLPEALYCACAQQLVSADELVKLRGIVPDMLWQLADASRLDCGMLCLDVTLP